MDTKSRAQIAEGLRWLARHRLLRVVAVLLGVYNFANQMGQAVLVLLATQTLHAVTVSLSQQIVPAPLLGRVNSFYRMLGWGLMPVGALAGGFVAHAAGLRGGRAPDRGRLARPGTAVPARPDLAKLGEQRVRPV